MQTLFFYIPVSGQLQLRTLFSRPEGVRLRERPLDFVESASVRYLRAYVMSFWYHSLVRFLIQKQRVRIYRTKHFPCGFVFIIYILRNSSFWQPFYFKSFQNAKICRHAPRNDKQNEAVKTFVHIILMRVRIWGNPRITSNVPNAQLKINEFN